MVIIKDIIVFKSLKILLLKIKILLEYGKVNMINMNKQLKMNFFIGLNIFYQIDSQRGHF